ncbi:hypothetical protein [Methylobacterium sp. J-077]|uniref:hypothetical protein n=1 Tax=Methylobacterium sp. J-077 TaxID=2836656 RepID=UPI001FBA3DFB|nr:hypothetical protein [Methylobacterium sp. J-077]MCJ2122405.1 hypothetical protein [Methylobacterium sp. J-077]
MNDVDKSKTIDDDIEDLSQTGTYLDEYDPRARSMIEKYGYGDTSISAKDAINRLIQSFVLCAESGEKQIELEISEAKTMFRNLFWSRDLDFD